VLLTIALALALHRPATSAARVRVGKFIPTADEGDALSLNSRRSVTPRLFRRGTWWAPFVHDVEIARSLHSPIALVKRGAAGGLVVAALVFLLVGSPLAALAPLLLWPIPLRMMIKRAARKQRALFCDTLPGYLQDLASAMRVGRSFAGALAVVAASADEPVRSELERAVTDEQLGRPIDESLEAVAKRMQDTDVDQVALIASLNRRSGSNVAEALDRVADGARDRADLRREIKALTAQGKMSSLVLTALPPLLLIGISLVSPQYAHPLFHTTIGIVLMGVGALMVFAGWKVMQKITTIKA
jgi:tight adherence protein B